MVIRVIQIYNPFDTFVLNLTVDHPFLFVSQSIRYRRV